MLIIKCTMKNASEGFKSNRQKFNCKNSCGNCGLLKVKSEDVVVEDEGKNYTVFNQVG